MKLHIKGKNEMINKKEEEIWLYLRKSGGDVDVIFDNGMGHIGYLVEFRSDGTLYRYRDIPGAFRHDALGRIEIHND